MVGTVEQLRLSECILQEEIKGQDEEGNGKGRQVQINMMK